MFVNAEMAITSLKNLEKYIKSRYTIENREVYQRIHTATHTPSMHIPMRSVQFCPCMERQTLLSCHFEAGWTEQAFIISNAKQI